MKFLTVFDIAEPEIYTAAETWMSPERRRESRHGMARRWLSLRGDPESRFNETSACDECGYFHRSLVLLEGSNGIVVMCIPCAERFAEDMPRWIRDMACAECMHTDAISTSAGIRLRMNRYFTRRKALAALVKGTFHPG